MFSIFENFLGLNFHFQNSILSDENLNKKKKTKNKNYILKSLKKYYNFILIQIIIFKINKYFKNITNSNEIKNNLKINIKRYSFFSNIYHLHIDNIKIQIFEDEIKYFDKFKLRKFTKELPTDLLILLIEMLRRNNINEEIMFKQNRICEMIYKYFDLNFI